MSHHRFHAFVLAAVTAIAGCIALDGSRRAELPVAYTRWTPPFVVRTSFPVAENDPLVTNLLALREQIVATLDTPHPSGIIEVYIFDERSSFERFVRGQYPNLPARRAFFIAQGSRRIVYTSRGESLDEDLRHEAAHALLHATVGTVPLWLDEGLAEYFERPQSDNGWHGDHVRELQASPFRPGLARLERLRDVGEMSRPDYREAWAWVHSLLHGSPESRKLLVQYLAEIRAGGSPGPMQPRLNMLGGDADTRVTAHVAQLVRLATPLTLNPRPDAANRQLDSSGR